MSYSDKLIAIDDAMVALGRPVPPVVSWLTRGLKGTNPNVAHAAWLRELEAWEDTNPEQAVRWHELRQQYITQERLELKARFDTDSWNYEQLRFDGCPDKYIDVIRGRMAENSSWKAARNFMLEGTKWSLVLIGGHGCGKSCAAAWLAHQMLMRNFGVVWIDCAQQCDAPMYGVAAEHLRWKCRTANVVVLDDLGSTERQLESKFWKSWLDDVVGTRANENRKSIITTNKPVVELGTWLGPRLVDRLNEGIINSTTEKSLRGQT